MNEFQRSSRGAIEAVACGRFAATMHRWGLLILKSLVLGAVILHASTANAQDQPQADPGGPPAAGLAAIDWFIIFAYAAGTLLLGWYYSRQQTSTKEYFVGSGNMNPILIGVSLFATLLSTISYLSTPGEVLGKGPVQLLSMLAVPAVYLVVGFVLLPVYMKQRVTSAYQLLEERLGRNIRLLGAGMFIVLRLVWMALLIYMTAEALTVMLGVGTEYIPVIAVVTGLIAVTYTSLGGLRAVVITDFAQTVLLFGGALLVLATITWKMGGVGWFPTRWSPHWDSQPVFSLNPSTRITVFGAILNYFIWYLCTLGGDQTSVQRFMATTDVRAARRALGTQMLVGIVVSLTLGLVGMALLGYFEAHPDRLDGTMSLKGNADQIFPHFIVYHLPAGISGFVVAAMFAAAMSSIDSGVNSITAVVLSDFFRQNSLSMDDSAVDGGANAAAAEVSGGESAGPYRTPATGNPEPGRKPDSHVARARWLAFAIGAFVVILSSGMGAIPGNITAVTSKTTNLLTTPIFSLFFFALFVPFASPFGVTVGAVCGTTTAFLIAFSGPIFGFVEGTELDPVSFQWIAPVAVLVNIGTGCIASLLVPRKKHGGTR